MPINTAPNSPFKGYYPNVNPFGISPRYNPSGLISYLHRNESKEVTTSAKAVDKEVANIEAEKGEILSSFNPLGVGFHDIKGKPHSKGGTPLNVPDGSFIFSKDKSMAMTPEELETFKLGGYAKGGLKNNTPAKVFKRNIDIKHNNQMLDFLENSKSFAEKNTARLMTEKYQQKAGTIAALQEIRKPDGQLPEYGNLQPQDIVSDRIAKQYSKGGWVGKYAEGGRKRISMDALNSNVGFIPTYQSDIMKANPMNMDALLAQHYSNGQDLNADFQEDPNKFSWIPKYDWTPKLISMAGNLMQMPKAYTPALALQSGYTTQAQTIDPQQGINAALSQAYATRKATEQYGTDNTARKQFMDTQFSEQAMNYGNQVNIQNQNVLTANANRNAEIQNQVLNNNNNQRATYIDKLNEMYQNVDDSRRQIGATNLNLFGQGYQENMQYNMAIEGMKRQYAWDVKNKQNTPTMQSQMQQVNSLIQNNPILEQHPIILNAIMKQMFQAKQQPSTQEDYLKRLMNAYGG